MTAERRQRCGWCGDDPLYQKYHDEEWGAPLRDERRLFELLCLEGAQAGLSWLTILRKRENYRAAFDNFDAAKIARYDARKVAALLADPGIVRSRLKVNGFVKNARAFLALRESGVTFENYLWDFVDGAPVQNQRGSMEDVPAATPVSERMAKELKKRGFVFVGGIICYAFMQSAGLVNDHLIDCYRHHELSGR